MKKKAALVVAVVLGLAGLGSAIHFVPQRSDNASHAEQAPRDGQIQAPPRPAREKPLERVVVRSK